MSRPNMDLLEPDAVQRIKERQQAGDFIPNEEGTACMLHSLAISMKRIADVMERVKNMAEQDLP